MDEHDLGIVMDETGVAWSVDDEGTYCLQQSNGLALDVKIMRLQGHSYLVYGSDRDGTATNWGMSRIDDMSADDLKLYLMGLVL